MDAMFDIDVKDMCWITEGDDPYDLCAHGNMTATIGNEKFEFSGTVSSTAIYLLKTLTENHLIGEDNQMMPCCGHFLIANDRLDDVRILGCPNGIDWSVIHENDSTIKIITESGKETLVNLDEYRKIVYKFADKVELFYKSCSDKILPADALDRDGYIAFWNEWKRRRFNM